ncbi:MAG TPA: cytochrome c [Candidatus Saccharimonadales bacterium]|nr:cytochrome c [Candidatus Saccharimonadales bacterium]
MSRGRVALIVVGLLVAAAIGLFIRSYRQDTWVPPGPPAEAGRILFERKHCIRCHKIAGVGGHLGPDLTVVASRRAPEWMDAFISDPRAIKPKAKMPRPRITDAQRAVILAYLKTLDGSAPPVPPGRTAAAP